MKTISQNDNKKNFVDVLYILGKLHLQILVGFALSTSKWTKRN